MKQLQCSSDQSIKLRSLCGHIYTQPAIIPWTKYWLIKIIPGYNANLAFHVLQVMYSDKCQIHHLEVTKTTHSIYSERYCGHLAPWLEACPCQTIQITLFVDNFPSVTKFNMSYYLSQIKKYSTRFYPNVTEKIVWPLDRLCNTQMILIIYLSVGYTSLIRFKISEEYSYNDGEYSHFL